MRRALVLLVPVALALSACSEPTGPAGEYEVSGEVTSVVLTTGLTAPPVIRRLPVAFSTLDNAVPNLGGSSTSRVYINGTACAAFPNTPVIISYTLSGNQASPASVDVNTVWNWNGSVFVGSNPATVNFPVKSGGGTLPYSVPVTITNTAGTGSGTAEITVAPFNLVTNMTDPAGQRLSLGTNSSATIYVAFNDCTPTNTPPWITVPPVDLIEEATSSTGASVSFLVAFGDSEDADEDLTMACTAGGNAVASGDEFPIGATEITCRVTDTGGLFAESSFTIHVQDTGAPQFDSFPAYDASNPYLIVADNLAGGTVDMSAFVITAKDLAKGMSVMSGPEVSPPVSITCTIGGQPADGYALAIGQGAWVDCTAADAASYRAPGETAAAPNVSGTSSFYVFMGLDLSGVNGFLAPLRNSAPYSAHKRGSAIPHKFLPPKYSDGTPAIDLAGGLTLKLEHTGSAGSGETTAADDPAAGSTAWRYDADSGHYIFNAKTAQNWALGTWSTWVEFAGLPLVQTLIEIRK